MLFTELVHAIHPHLMKDADVPNFMRNLIQMMCDIPEEDWSTKKDPSSLILPLLVIPMLKVMQSNSSATTTFISRSNLMENHTTS